MSEITPLNIPKPLIEVEVRGSHHTGKTAVAVVIAEALRKHFGDHQVNVVSTDGMIKETTHDLQRDPVAFQERLKNAGNIVVLDLDGRAQTVTVEPDFSLKKA